MEKTVDAFRTISEVARDLDLPQHVLRFWETRFAQIKPLKRGGGRRYYRREDIELLRAIRQLLYDEGYTIKGVQKLHRELGARRFASGSAAEAEAEAAPGPDGSSRADGQAALPADARARLESALASLEAAKARLDALLGAVKQA
jgi:DNA-binding transcriptional MerR regulator